MSRAAPGLEIAANIRCFRRQRAVGRPSARTPSPERRCSRRRGRRRTERPGARRPRIRRPSSRQLFSPTLASRPAGHAGASDQTRTARGRSGPLGDRRRPGPGRAVDGLAQRGFQSTDRIAAPRRRGSRPLARPIFLGAAGPGGWRGRSGAGRLAAPPRLRPAIRPGCSGCEVRREPGGFRSDDQRTFRRAEGAVRRGRPATAGPAEHQCGPPARADGHARKCGAVWLRLLGRKVALRLLLMRGGCPPQTSTSASSAFSWMNSRRGSTKSPISLENMSSASSACSTFTCRSTRALSSSVVSQSCSAFISPRPL